MADAPQVTQLPQAPQRSLGAADYSQVADVWAAAIGPWTTQVNALAVAVNGYAISAVTAAGQAVPAANAAMAARDAAQLAAQNAQNYSAAAQAAIGAPALVGNANKVLTVNANATGVIWKDAGIKIGDILWSDVDPGSNYLLCDGNGYKKSDYPLLAAVVPDVKDYSENFTFPTNPAGAVALAAVCRVTDDILMAVGASGTIIRSTDKGQTWTKIAVPSGVSATISLTCISADDTRGVVIIGGASGTVLRSSDSGATFTNISTAVGASTTAIGAVAGWTGFYWMIAYGSTLKYSGDDGATWQTPVTQPVVGTITSIGMLRTSASNSGGTQFAWQAGNSRTLGSSWVAGSTGLIARNETFGQSQPWTLLSTTVSANSINGSAGLNDDGTVMMVGAAGTIISSDDGLTNISYKTGNNANGVIALNAVASRRNGEYVLAGNNGTLQITRNNGKDFKALQTKLTANLTGVAMTKEGVIVAVAAGGQIAVNSLVSKFASDNFGTPIVSGLNGAKAYIKAKEAA